MLKGIPDRITYVQEKLLKMVEMRKLRAWCNAHDVVHATVYKLAVGDNIPTYDTLLTFSHLFSPIEWLFYTDESLPCEPFLMEPRDWHDAPCRYVYMHRNEYKTIAEKYGINRGLAIDIFRQNRRRLPLQFIREAILDGVPAKDLFEPIDKDFLADLEPETFYPPRGTIFQLKGKTYFTVSTIPQSEKLGRIIVCKVSERPVKGDFIQIAKSQQPKYIALNDIKTISATEHIRVIDRLLEDATEKALEALRNTFM